MLAFAVMFSVGSLGAYLWAREFVSSRWAMWAGILYAVAPYRLNQLYQASLLAEFAGAAILPFTFFFAERVCTRRTRRDVAGLAASYAILVFTHLPLTVIGSIALLVYALVRLNPFREWRTLISLAIAAGLGLAASASYWTTMISELDWIRADNIKPYSFIDYRSNFLLSTFSPENLNVWWMNILLLSTVAMFWPGFVVFRRSIWKTSTSRGMKAAAALLLVSLAMGTQISTPIWKLIRPLQETQFPWRWLALTSLVCPLLFASALPFWIQRAGAKSRSILLIAAGTMAIALAFSVSHIIREAQFLDHTAFDATLRAIPGSEGVTQWWPRWVDEPKEMPREVDAGSRAVAIRSWQSENRVFVVQAGEPADIRVRTFYYPHWMATANNNNLLVRPDRDGAMLITVPAQQTEVALEFREPARVRWARIITISAWIAIVGLACFGTRKKVSPSIAA